LSVDTTSELWAPLALTKLEELVVEALQGVDERIEKIAFAYPQRLRYSGSNRGGFRVKLKDSENPVPIGSLGDGVWRIIAIAIAAVSARGSVLLVDEIDTGLHFTVLDGLWKTLLKLSNSLDIQVFATTHSRDCVERLATICHPDSTIGNQVTIQRIESNSEVAVAYSEAEILLAAQRGFEVR
jgi:ABC-type branched-subunit amino acid transport system ATPase component